MNRPWMPLYVADYRADTAHLTAAEHGAYLLLIMHYWQTGGLPTEDEKLCRIASMTPAEWRRCRDTIAEFFDADWKHKRIEAELQKVQQISERRRASAQQRHSKTHANAEQMQSKCNASAEQMDTHSHPQAQSKSSDPNGSGEAPSSVDPKKQLFDRGREILGPKSGGLIAKVLKSFGNEDDLKAIAKARARLEEASTKANPNEWLGRVIVNSNNGNYHGPAHKNGLASALEKLAEAANRTDENGLFEDRPEPSRLLSNG